MDAPTSPMPARTRSFRPRLLPALALAAGYAALALLASPLALPSDVLPIWPSAGLGLFALLIWGPALAPGIWLGDLCASLWLYQGPGQPFSLTLMSAAAAACGATLQALFGYWLIRLRLGAGNPLRETANLPLLMLLAGPLTCVISASFGVTSQLLLGSLPLAAAAITWLTWWAGDTAGMLLIAPTLLALHQEPRRRRPRRLLGLLGPALVIVVASSLLYSVAQQRSATDRTQHLRNQTDRAAMHLRQRLNHYLNTLYALRGYLQTQRDIEASDFTTFTRALLRHSPGLQALEWIPQLEGETEREALEARDGIRITERTADGLLAPAARRAEYFPVRLVEPLDSNRAALGFDLGSSPARRQALLRARDENRVIATAPITLVQERGSQRAILVIAPVYREPNPPMDVASRRQQLRGFALSVIRLGDVVEESMPDHALLQPHIRDLAMHGDAARLFGSGAPMENDTAQHYTIHFGGREWLLSMQPGKDADATIWLAPSLLIAGIGFAIALQAFLILLIGRSREISYLVEQRTAELSQRNLELRQESQERRQAERHASRARDALVGSEQRWQFALQGSRDGVWDWNAKSGEVYFSPRWQEMLGHAPGEIPGHVSEWDKRVHPDDRDQVYADLNAHLQGHSPYYENEHRVRCKDGSYIWILDRGMVVERDADGAPLRAIGTHTDITERKEMEAALAQERALFIAGPTVIFKWRAAPDWPVEYVSPNIESVFGYRPEQLLSGEVPFAQLVHPDDLERVAAEVARYSARGVHHFEQHYRMRTVDGDWRSLYDLTVVVRNDAGEVTHYHGYVIDDTERQAAAEALLESEGRYRKMAENSPLPIMIHVDGKLEFINAAATSAFGYASAAEMIGMPAIALVAERSRPDIAEARRRLVEEAAPHTGTANVQMLRRDGSEFTVEAVGNLIDFEGVTAMQITFLDITERQQTVDALRASETRLRQLFESSNDLIFIHDTQGNILDANQMACDVLGETRAALRQRNVKSLHPQSEWEQSKAAIDELRQRGRVRFEVLFHRQDGSTFAAEVSAAIADRDKGIVQSIVRNIEARKRAERALLEHRDTLQELVDQRTEELVHAMDEAIAANRAKSEFLANMSHELRTPMHGILSFARLGGNKVESADKAKLAHYFDRIETSGERLMGLLNNLLDLSRLEVGRLELDLRPGNLCEVVEAATEEFGASLSERKLNIHLDDGDSCRTELRFDHDRMLQVLRNLLSNAIKFSPPGGHIELLCQRDGDSVELTLRDQGPGIPEDELESVFDKFVQSSKTRSGAGGSGLGLAITRQLVELHGGSIRAENHPDGGALLRLKLPLRA